MKDLHSKEYCCYKIHTLLMKRSACPPSIDNTPIWITPSPFVQENFDPPP